MEDGKIDKVLEHKKLKLLSILDAGPSYEGTIVRSRNDMIQLEVISIKHEDGDMRKNLRVAVRFKSLIYPLTGRWKGRREIESNDISAGGIAFFTDYSLQVGEQLEVVVPVTSEPLVVRCQILRKQELRNGKLLYAVKFVDMCEDEEVTVREAVFSIQLENRPHAAGNDNREEHR